MKRDLGVILVHGAFMGEWVWEFVRPALLNYGLRVYTPTLSAAGKGGAMPGIGSSQVDLGTHILEVTRLIESMALDQVVLVGHSYAGLVITGVAERLLKRVTGLVYLDAVVPFFGGSLIDSFDPLRRHDVLRTLADSVADGRWFPDDPQKMLRNFGMHSGPLFDWALERLSGQAIKSVVEKLPSDIMKSVSDIPKYYVYFSDKKGYETFHQSEMLTKNNSSFIYSEIFAGHCAQLTHPYDVAVRIAGITAHVSVGW